VMRPEPTQKQNPLIFVDPLGRELLGFVWAIGIKGGNNSQAADSRLTKRRQKQNLSKE
jgi:hypothetical protein